MRTVVSFEEIDRTQLAIAGGKGASLGELTRIPGIRVPAGFCVTTHAFRRLIGDASIDDLLDRLSLLTREDHGKIRALSADIRNVLEQTRVPDDVAAEIAGALSRLGGRATYAVRSSATAEDLPTASFAGQHDTYLNVSGRAILEQVRRCWASLFTERAVTYRIVNGIDHRKVRMAVVVQRMVDAEVSGIMFTADPMTGNRTTLSIEAAPGLGEELVSGHASADVFTYRHQAIVNRTIVRAQPALTDAQVERLARQGRQIEAHFGSPQDIEWCLADDEIYVVQSRPITTLFPIPTVADSRKHVYVSTGHQQMYTAAMKPLGISVRQLTAKIPMHEAGGRLFVDITQAWMSPAARAGVLAMLGKSDPLTGDALRTLIERDDPFSQTPDAGVSAAAPPAAASAPAPIATDPAIVAELIANAQASNAKLERDIENKSGPELIDFILADFQELQRILFDARSSQAIMAGMEAAWWLNDNLEAWLGEKGAADVLAQSVSNNITSEMGLDLLRVADVIRPHREVVAFLEGAVDENFMKALPAVAGGRDALHAIRQWLDRYGMRCVGEIDITRPRWIEQPSALIPLILGNVRNFEAGAGEHRFERGLAAARAKEADVLERLRALPDGEAKARETKEMIDRMRTFAGYREYPKYFFISRYWPYKRALKKEGERLAQAGVIGDASDIFFLALHELREIARTHEVDSRLIDDRRAAFTRYEALTPPRVLTSDGEMLAGSYRRDDLPPGAFVGLAVSTGIVEGRARVVLDPSEANLEPGDILVTPFTDPSWTPAFVAITGLVTEVGGLTTHGAVIAREYGLPAVVNVEHATRLIRDGQRIRVDGTNGFVELLSYSPDVPLAGRGY